MDKKDLQKAIKLKKQLYNIFNELKGLSQKGLMVGGLFVFVPNKEQFMEIAKEVKAEIKTKHYEAIDWHDAVDVAYFDYKGAQVINDNAGFEKA